MALIVDGNNVIGQTPGWHRDKPGSRRRLLGELSAYVAVKKTRLTVVFDGAPDDGISDGSTVRGVKVYFAHRGLDADSVIARLVRDARDPRGITVVTSDRRLAVDCKGFGARIIGSGEFRKAMAEVAGTSGDADPGASEAPAAGDIQDWSRYFGVDPDADGG